MSAQQQQQKPIYLISNLRKRNAKAIKTGESSGNGVGSELVEEINLLRSQLAAAHNEISQLKALNVKTMQQVNEVKVKTDYLYDDKMTLRDAQKYVIKEFFKHKIRQNTQSQLDVAIYNDALYRFSKEMGITIDPIETQSLMSELSYPYSVCEERNMCYYPGIELLE